MREPMYSYCRGDGGNVVRFKLVGQLLEKLCLQPALRCFQLNFKLYFISLFIAFCSTLAFATAIHTSAELLSYFTVFFSSSIVACCCTVLAFSCSNSQINDNIKVESFIPKCYINQTSKGSLLSMRKK